METNNWLIPLITFICGWKMSKGFYRVNELLKLINIMTGFMTGTMSDEQVRKELKELN